MTPLEELLDQHKASLFALPTDSTERLNDGYWWACESVLMDKDDGTRLTLDLRLGDARVRSNLDEPFITGQYRLLYRSPDPKHTCYEVIRADGEESIQAVLRSALTDMDCDPALADTAHAVAMNDYVERVYQATASRVPFDGSTIPF
jgi:hypothetical protein